MPDLPVADSAVSQVLIRDTHEDTGLCGQIGVVRGVTPGMCSVFLYEEERCVLRSHSTDS